MEELKEKSINEKEILAVVEEEGNTWMTPICEYLTKEILPADKKKARAVRRKAARKNDEALEVNLDLIEEKREQAAIQEAKSKTKMEKYYNSRVCGTSFRPGDMVYRSNDASHARDGGKLGAK
ncbi:hypothetical protein Tco_1131347 [Tanacetum coccineum]